MSASATQGEGGHNELLEGSQRVHTSVKVDRNSCIRNRGVVHTDGETFSLRRNLVSRCKTVRNIMVCPIPQGDHKNRSEKACNRRIT